MWRYNPILPLLISIVLFPVSGGGKSFKDSSSIIIVNVEDGVPTCDPSGYYSNYPYTGYRISYEFRIPFQDTEKLSSLSYTSLISSQYPKYFVLSTCDMNFVMGEIAIPVRTNEDVWNKTMCSDIIPIGTNGLYDHYQQIMQANSQKSENIDKNQKSKNTQQGSSYPIPPEKFNFGINNQSPIDQHPFFDMFLNYRLQMFHKNEPDVRPQYCFHLAKARKFARNNILTAEWDKHLFTNNFVGGLYECLDKRGTKHNPANGDIICSSNNIRPLMPMYRDSWKYMWAVLVAKSQTSSAKVFPDSLENNKKGIFAKSKDTLLESPKNTQDYDDENKEDDITTTFEDESMEWVVRVPWLYTPDIYDIGFPQIINTVKLLELSDGSRKKSVLRQLSHTWTKDVDPFEDYFGKK